MRLTSLIAGLVASFALIAVGHAQNRAPATNTSAPTFTRDVAPIMFAKCASCHRPGEVAPMPLLSYTDARPWASAIKQRVSTRVMPPWHADPAHGTFRNDLRLSDREIDTIVRWVDGGAREGEASALPPLPKFPEGWQIGTPDAVFEMAQEFEVPASGEIPYQYFEVPTNFTEDRWMQAGEVRAGDRAHVHHIIVYVREPGRTARPNVVSVRSIPNTAAAPAAPAAPRPQPAVTPAARPAAQGARPTGGGDAMLVNWAVGEDAPIHLPGTAKRIPAGSTLIFQVHYTTNGTPGRDRSRIGLVFAKQPPQREIRTGLITNATFAIPPGADSHAVEAEATFSEDVKIYSMHPHMHLRGKDMTYTATYPDGREEILLRVPKYDFGWQTDYWLAQPLLLPKGTKVHVAAHFDNSPANRANPDPKATVRWGDQTWEEMMIGFFTYTVEGGK
ncbi:MAG: c-type cytochrome [Vicinamibacterales bacterium]